MSLTVQLLFVTLVCMYLVSPSLQRGERVIRMSKPGPMKTPTRHGHMKKPVAPPPVDETFTTDCTTQKKNSRHIECGDNGTFSPIQCRGRRCYCVDTETGERLNSKHFEKDTVNCTGDFAVMCPVSRCHHICTSGYKMDRDGQCQTCMCEPKPPTQQCDTVFELVEFMGCHCDCISLPETLSDHTPRSRSPKGPLGTIQDCPVCNMTCDEMRSETDSDTCVRRIDDCSNETELRSVGRHGKRECIPKQTVNDRCDPPSKGPGRKGPKRNRPSRMRKIGRAPKTCLEGFVCKPVGFNDYRCQPEITTPCMTARATDENNDCDGDGLFTPVQCSPVTVTETVNGTNSTNSTNSASSMCRCVDPDSGATIEGSEVIVNDGEEKPTCQPKTYADCQVAGIYKNDTKNTFKVTHGDDYFDFATCRTCTCDDGDPVAYCSGPGNCTTVDGNTTANCTLDSSDVIPHGEALTIDCDTCTCRNGNVQCLRNQTCEVEANKTACDKCCDLPPSGPVCGPDGVNHKSRCYAINCAGIPATDLFDGPCQSQDICDLYPCDEGEFCLSQVGVACLGISGCTQDQLRTCINVTGLECPPGNDTNNETVSGDETTQVCGSDDNTYSSICNLIQTSVNVEMAYSGPCDAEECTSIGEVCGSDRVTYSNPCVLKSTATTRLDYLGACETNATTVKAICEKVMMDNRCMVTAENCKSPSFPKDGCCPICGGAVTMSVDRYALSDAAATNPAFQTVDIFAFKLFEQFLDAIEVCTVDWSLTDNSDLQITLTSTDDSTSQSCGDTIQEIAVLVNIGVSKVTSRTTRAIDGQNSLPQVFDFTLAASTAPLFEGTVDVVETDATTVTTTTSGSPPATNVHWFPLVSVLVITLLSLLLQF